MTNTIGLTVATPGSISTGTQRPQDLLASFSKALEKLRPENGRNLGTNTLLFDAEIIRGAISHPHCPENSGLFSAADDILHNLASALNEHAPPGHYFGAHPRDSADFGFWPQEKEEVGPIEEWLGTNANPGALVELHDSCAPEHEAMIERVYKKITGQEMFLDEDHHHTAASSVVN